MVSCQLVLAVQLLRRVLTLANKAAAAEEESVVPVVVGPPVVVAKTQAAARLSINKV